MLPLLVALACGPKSTARLDVEGHAVRVEIAANPEARARGLMHRDRLPENAGMLFVYPDEQIRTFWMKDTRIPLTIAFADRTGRVVHLADLKPFDTRGTSSVHPAKYALEVNRGWFEARGIGRGAVLRGIPEDLDVR